ncbi:hypothetical protein GWI33_006224 [Rhynchophorus ferrugineus]|uniref:Uncharacterized protein n=1 Tax=Rhynchophorus ferrugineus TaxID=354439 RepID=A0A834IM00_RHYFE|nr:hypothetical protein GWI33_006224 [Rhynchophorus ferrugineus]
MTDTVESNGAKPSSPPIWTKEARRESRDQLSFDDQARPDGCRNVRLMNEAMEKLANGKRDRNLCAWDVDDGKRTLLRNLMP